jgi:cobalt-zinc-cadmium resistance protein CzcA
LLAALVDLALKQRLITLLTALALCAWGIYSYSKLPVDAFPDVAPIQVLVSMRAPGLAPEELESRVTSPVEIAVRGIPNLVSMRSITRYSAALMTFEFADGTDIYWARAQVNERLQEIRDQLPAGTEGGLAPIVTALGEMLMFTVESDTMSVQEIRSLIDWTIRPRLRGLPGVADVNVLGGFVRIFEVVPSAPAMAARGITTEQLEKVLVANNRNDGAGRVREGEEALLVRSEGRIRTLDDVRNTIVTVKSNTTVRVGDVADVREGALPRNGVITANAEGEAVWTTVLGLRGANAKTVVSGVKQRLKELEPLLPQGAKIVIFYDRNELIEKAVWTVQRVLIEAIVLVVILLVLFLGNLRAAVVVAACLPLAVLSTFVIMRLFGWSANIMSLGGLAIAIGLLVDCAVVVVENVEHRIAEKKNPDLKARLRITLDAVKEVGVPLVSGVVIIITVFMPLLSLQGLEGRLFSPVALTIGFALAAALLLSLTVIPVLAAFLITHGSHQEPWLIRQLHKGYDPLLAKALDRPRIVAGVVISGLLIAGVAFTGIGSTFLPTMDEGTPVVSIRKYPTISVDEAAETDLLIQKELKAAIPEIDRIMARAGADELGLDPAPINETDFFMTLKPRNTWRGKDTKWLMEEMRKVLDPIPGISFAFAQPIDMRVQEMIIGARGDVVVKIFGDDIPALNKIGREISAQIKKVPGATDVFALRNSGQKYFTVKVDRAKAGRLGLNATDVQDALRIWVDGKRVGIVLEGSVRTPLVIRGEAGLRASSDDLSHTPIVLPGGGTVELSQLADIKIEDGPIQVIREDGQRFATVLANVEGRDLVGFVADAQAAVKKSVPLPVGYTLDWGGQFENQQRAAARLAIVVPIALAMIFLLLYLTFGSVRQSILVFCNVPFACIGGVIALRLSGEFLSVPASVGFIALLGIAVLNGVVMVTYINDVLINYLNEQRGNFTLREAIMDAARRRLRPVTLTAAIAALGLVPFLFATGPGSEIQKPLAIVVIGGLVTATLLTLIVLPLLYERFGISKAARESIEGVVTPDGPSWIEEKFPAVHAQWRKGILAARWKFARGYARLRYFIPMLRHRDRSAHSPAE